MADVDVVIVNYRSAALTAACIDAIHDVAAQDNADVNIVVVNNRDSRADLDTALAGHGTVHVIHNTTNTGFGAACNLGALRGGASLILFLNPDTILHPGYFKSCIAFMRAAGHETIGVLGPAIEAPSGELTPTCAPLPTPARLLARSLGTAAFLPLRAHAISRPVGQVMGAVFMVRRAVFDQLGGFDTRFFLYYEDVDFCARAAAAGAISYYLKEARATHIGRASSRHDQGMAIALFLSSKILYARLHFGGFIQGLIAGSVFLAEFPLRLLRSVLGGDRLDRRSVLRAYGLLLRHIISGRTIVALAQVSEEGR